MNTGDFIIAYTGDMGYGYLAKPGYNNSDYTFIPDMVQRFHTRAQAEHACRYTGDFEAVVKPAAGSTYANQTHYKEST